MATPTRINSKSPTIKRIMREAAEFSSSPSPDYIAAPLESDLFEWHFTIRGPPNSAFAEGMYHGRIVLPPTYPLRPPSFRFMTPSGRFEANREICLSISGHHEETWQPAWGVRTALVALRSFMETDAGGQIGGLTTGDAVRKRLAAESQGWTCSVCAKSNDDILKEVAETCAEMAAQEDAEEKAKPAEVEVPAELRLGFRDEMEKQNKASEAADAESAELAEGFVQTVPIPDQQSQPLQPPATSSLPARPGQGVPQPTRTIPLPEPAHVPLTVTRQYDPNAGVPVWIDYAIISLVGILVAMLLKILLGY
jgi:ubiquitin-conjugating enzyme E2 J1